MATCSTCGNQAVCAFGPATAEEFGCRDHDPLMGPGAALLTQPAGWQYRTLPEYRTLPPRPWDAMLGVALHPRIVITNDGHGST
jgi:hypothetical protein